MKCKTHKEEMPDGICDSCLREEDQREKKPTWYEASTGNHQGLIIDEATGRNVAVTYDKADAPLVAAAPKLLRAAKKAVELMKSDGYAWKHGIVELREAIADAEGGRQK